VDQSNIADQARMKLQEIIAAVVAGRGSLHICDTVQADQKNREGECRARRTLTFTYAEH
jgi:hypothetical protein